jgi:PadR family transcriptional regulator, regulatory protein PadR
MRPLACDYFCMLKQIVGPAHVKSTAAQIEGAAMPRGDLLGSLEHIVLLAVARLGANAYGMTVRQEIENRTGRNLSIGAVYATLERLESKGFVSSSMGEPTAERGGRAKRHFRLEADGEHALAASQDAIRRMTVGLPRWRRA